MRIMTGRDQRRGLTMLELLVACCLVAIALTLAAPAAVQMRQDARRMQCANSLKQIGLALHNYHDAHGSLAPGWTAHHAHPQSGLRLGWSTAILPYMEQMPLFDLVDFNQPAKTEARILQTGVSVYRCPADTTPATNPMRSGYGTSNYSANFGDQPLPRPVPGRLSASWPGQPDTPMGRQGFSRATGLFWLNSSVRFRDVTDGMSNTIMVGERSYRSGAGVWPGVGSNEFENDQVTDSSFNSPLNQSFTGYSSLHSGGANFLFGDGSVRFIANQVDSAMATGERGVYQNLANPRDGNPISNF